MKRAAVTTMKQLANKLFPCHQRPTSSTYNSDESIDTNSELTTPLLSASEVPSGTEHALGEEAEEELDLNSDTQGSLYSGLPGGGGLLETNNTIEHPTGPQYQLVAGEGTYVLRDDLHLATPPPHPSDAPQPNNNPLATTIGPPTAGTKLSIAIFAPRKPASQGLFRSITHQSTRSAVPPSIQEEVGSPKSDAGSMANGFGWLGRGYGDGNPALAPAPVKGKKGDQRPKPKNNIIKSNSSYVSRVIPHEQLQKRLGEHAPEGTFAFANVNRAFQWLDLSSDIKVENMTKVLFQKANCLCHDVNQATKSPTHIDVIMGFNTGDIIWYEPISQKYSRLNKNGIINKAAMASIQWLPGKQNFFLAAHMDGTLVVYDKDKEDVEFVPEEPLPTSPTTNGNGATLERTETNSTEDSHTSQLPPRKQNFHVLKSIHSRNQKANPVAAYKLSNSKINAIAFSPDSQHLATVSDDGLLTIIDYVRECVVDIYRSYYGSLLAVTWSPDGRYVLTGGQDDLVSIWSLVDRSLVARCVGHHSWVTDVKFDPYRCDERNYRFGSVGEDCRLLLWDFSVGMLGRPRTVSLQRQQRERGSISSHLNPLDRSKTHGTVSSAGGGVGGGGGAATGRVRSNSALSQTQTRSDREGVDGEADDEDGPTVHPVASMRSAAVLPPVLSKVIDNHPLCWLGFEENCVITSCKDGEY